MKKINNATNVAERIDIVRQTGSIIYKASNKLVESVEENINRLESRRIAYDEKIANSARRTFPNTVPYVEHTNSTSDEQSSSNQSSILKLNVGGKHIDISRSCLTQIKRSKLALIFSGLWDEILPRDKDGRIFMDFDPSWMDPIITYLRELADASDTETDISDDNQFGVMPLMKYLGLQWLYEDNSLRVSPKQWAKIKSWIPNNKFDQSTPRLIFKGSRDGFTAAAFHCLCDGVPDTVTIVKDTDDSVFGGYADVAWRSYGDNVESSNSFIFTLAVSGDLDSGVFRVQRGHSGEKVTALIHDADTMASFGMDLNIEDRCNKTSENCANCGAAYGNEGEGRLNGIEESFKVAEILVYTFTPATDTIKSNPLTSRWNINEGCIALPPSVESSQSSMNDVLASYHSFFDILNDINKKNIELDFVEMSFNDQARFLRSFVNRMMKVNSKEDLDDESEEEEESDEDDEAEDDEEPDAEIIRSCDRIISFNVSGTIFTVSVGILSQIPESMLWSGYMSGRWRAEDHVLDDDGNILLDHDPSNFATLINLLRLKSMVTAKEFVKLSRKLLEAFSAERMTSFKRSLDYFQIGLGFVGVLDTTINMSISEVHSFLDGTLTTTNKLSLIFRGSRDGFTAAAFHDKCDGVADTITIIQDTSGNVFGCENGFQWNTSPCYTNNCSLFSLKDRCASNFRDFNSPDNYNMAVGGFMVAFGSGLVISECCNENSLSLAAFDDESNKQFLPAGRKFFKVAEIEVWHRLD